MFGLILNESGNDCNLAHSLGVNSLDNGPYIWKIRAACGSNGTTWATPFSDVEFYNLGALRVSESFILDIYPNPSEGIFNLDLNGTSFVEIRILNSIGQEIKEFTTSKNTLIDLSNNAKGIYSILIKSGDDILTKKIVLQ